MGDYIIATQGYRVCREGIRNNVYIGIASSLHWNRVGRDINLWDAIYTSHLRDLSWSSNPLRKPLRYFSSLSRRHNLVVPTLFSGISTLLAVYKAEANLIFLLVLSFSPLKGLVFSLFSPVFSLAGLVSNSFAFVLREFFYTEATGTNPP